MNQKNLIVFLTISALTVMSYGQRNTQAVPDKAVDKAEKFFLAALGDEKTLPIVLKGLQSTGEAELLPLFAAISRSGDKRHRLLATALAGELAGKKAGPILLERLQTDPAMAVRATAMIHLAAIEAISPDQLISAMKIDDEGIQIIAARALVRAGRSRDAKPTLEKLAKSRDSDTAILARMSLLGIGDRTQIGYLRKAIMNPKTQSAQLIRMMDQIRLEKIGPALPVAKFLAQPDRLQPVRVRAFMAINELSPRAAQLLAGAIRTSDSLVFRLRILRILAGRADGRTLVGEFAAGAKDDSFAVVARFELSRKAGGEKAENAVEDALTQKHPVVIEYVLSRMREDIKADPEKAEFYTMPVMEYVRTAELDREGFSPAHDRVAMAVELLGKLGSKNARKGLWEILRRRDANATKQVAAGALYRCKNKQIASLLYPMLKSPYPEMKTYSALSLGKHGNASAVPALLDLQNQTPSSQAGVLTLTNWYLLKLSSPERSAQALAKIVKAIEAQ